MPWSTKKLTAADAQRRKQYDSPEYRAARKSLAALVTAGNGYCWRCGRYLPPGCKWDTGHDDYDRTVIRGAECRSCNRGTAARKAALIVNTRRRTRTSRTWR